MDNNTFNEKLNMDELFNRRKITEEHARKWCKENDIKLYFETSAKNNFN